MLDVSGHTACDRLDAILIGPPIQTGGQVGYRWGVGLCLPVERNAIEVPEPAATRTRLALNHPGRCSKLDSRNYDLPESIDVS